MSLTRLNAARAALRNYRRYRGGEGTPEELREDVLALKVDAGEGLRMGDTLALDLIAERMDGAEWDADTCDAIAELVRTTGRKVDDVDPHHADDVAGEGDETCARCGEAMHEAFREGKCYACCRQAEGDRTDDDDDEGDEEDRYLFAVTVTRKAVLRRTCLVEATDANAAMENIQFDEECTHQGAPWSTFEDLDADEMTAERLIGQSVRLTDDSAVVLEFDDADGYTGTMLFHDRPDGTTVAGSGIVEVMQAARAYAKVEQMKRCMKQGGGA